MTSAITAWLWLHLGVIAVILYGASFLGFIFYWLRVQDRKLAAYNAWREERRAMIMARLVFEHKSGSIY